MPAGFLCDSLNFVLDIFDFLAGVAFILLSPLGFPGVSIRDLLGLGSIGGCNI